MTDISGKTVLITGAASGIGRATALRSASAGARLVLTDVAPIGAIVSDIEALGAEVVHAASLDISDYEAVQGFADAVHERVDAVDVVMNIAGISSWGTVSSLEHRQWRAMVDVNLMGPIHVIECFLPQTVEAQRGGHLVNVSSAAGLIGMPWHAAYSASKFGLRGVSEVLRFDLRKHGIRVSLVCPGGVDTGLVDTIDIAGVDKTTKSFTKVHGHFKKRAVSADKAAESILKGVRRNKYMVYTSFDIRAAFALQRMFPPGYNLVMRIMNAGANKALPAVEKARVKS